MLFCPCVVRKATVHVETKTLNMRHQAQKGFCGIFVGIPQHQKGYLLYVPSTRKVISLYDVFFYNFFSSMLSYTPQPYSEAMVMRLAVTYTLYVTSSKEKTGDVITFAQFEEGNILFETRKDTEISDESDSESLIMNEHEMENLNNNEKSNHDLISTETLHDIRDRNQTHQTIDKMEARCKICYCIKQRQS